MHICRDKSADIWLFLRWSAAIIGSALPVCHFRNLTPGLLMDNAICFSYFWVMLHSISGYRHQKLETPRRSSASHQLFIILLGLSCHHVLFFFFKCLLLTIRKCWFLIVYGKCLKCRWMFFVFPKENAHGDCGKHWQIEACSVEMHHAWIWHVFKHASITVFYTGEVCYFLLSHTSACDTIKNPLYL